MEEALLLFPDETDAVEEVAVVELVVGVDEGAAQRKAPQVDRRDRKIRILPVNLRRNCQYILGYN